jgi:hypothetical protein
MMADTKTLVGAVGAALVIGALGGAQLDPGKAEQLESITVAEMVASKIDSTAQRIEAADKVREAGRETVYDIKPAEVAEDGKILAPAETLSVKEVDIPRAIVRPENTIRVPEIPTGEVFRVVAFVGEKAVAEWAAPITEAPDAAKITRGIVQVTIIDQVR